MVKAPRKLPAARLDPSALARKAALYRTLLVIGFFVLWEVLANIGAIDERSASKPTAILAAFGEMFAGNTDTYQALSDTLYVLVIAFIIAVAIGMPLGLALALNATIREAYMSIVIYLLGIPKTIFLPLFVLFFGLGNGSAIAFGAVLGFLQITVNVVAGVDSIEPRFFRVASAFGGSKWHSFVHVILPGAAPAIFAGLWHGVRNAFIGVLIAQMFVSNIGIGYLVKVYTNNFNIDSAMVLIIISAVAVILLGTLWELGEARLTKWKSTVRS
ncbi:NitT/TauT family transport system permease protein/taurine transport system permease protein [Mycetocola miduiensis]|jgi:ABC-type nitrate/sulfonate/bicarbonate transport system permease component|uniref:NitT/TauT family transport system permease protein/taurine transport system permease protein n=2 Tax=Mycetocola miduiensis TaxID=995034 RepID=A0A1I4Z017_9MICO|nr:NitT/TauT family transport system permease protein/taurine transport system permease protein [Mycetocola miduiensis]